MFESLLQALDNGTIKANESFTSAGLAALQEVFDRKDFTELRFYIPYAWGSGHQASSVMLLKNMIELGFNKKIRIYYDDYHTFSKLVNLLPGLNSDEQEVKVNDITVFVSNKTPDSMQPLGITGGYDETNYGMVNSLIEQLKVDVFLQLQPFDWPVFKTNSYSKRKRLHKIWKLNSTNEYNSTNAYNSTDLEAEFTHFITRAYYMQDTKVWDELDKLDQHYLGMKVANAINNFIGSIDYMPVYGISVGNDEARTIPCNPEIMLCNIVFAVNYAKTQIKNNKPTVIHIFHDLDISTCSSFVDKNKKGYLDDDIKIKFYFKKGEYFQDNFDDFFQDISDTINEAADKDNYIYIVANTGPVPPDVFNYLYSKATMPFVFEGQCTASLALNLGKPYFHLADGRNPYPENILADDPNINSAYISDIAQLIHKPFEKWEAKTNKHELSAIKLGNFIFECMKANPSYLSFFTKIREAYHQYSDDKLIMALLYCQKENYFKSNLNTETGLMTANAALLPADENILDAFYIILQANTSDRILNLIPGALSAGKIFDLYQNVFKGSGIKIHNADIKSSSTEITATGTWSVFNIENMPVSFTFTADNEGQYLISVMKTWLDGDWDLPGIPWVSLKNFYLTAQVANKDTWIFGSGGARINLGSSDLQLEFDLPLLDNRLVLSGSFLNNKPNITSVYQAIGGINLAAIMPAPLNAAADLAVDSFGFAYDLDTNTVTQMNVGISTPNPWPLFGKVSLEEISIDATIASPANLQKRTVTYLMQGTFAIGEGIVEAGASYPDLWVSGTLADSGKPVSLDDFITKFLPDAKIDLKSDITYLSLYFAPGPPKIYRVEASLGTDWTIKIAENELFNIANLSFRIEGTGEKTNGSITGTTQILPGDPDSPLWLSLSAEYLGSLKQWVFTGHQTGGDISVIKLLTYYIDPGWAPTADIKVNHLALEIVTGSKSFTMSAALADSWYFRFLPDMKIDNASFEISYKNDNGGWKAQVSAEIQYYFIELKLMLDYDSQSSSGIEKFSMTWGEVTGTVEKDKQQHWIGTITLKDQTLGGIIREFISWATGQSFGLAAPWNLLENISLNSLALQFDFNLNQVSVSYAGLNINLGIARIDKITVTYLADKNQGVNVELNGFFSWQESDILSWDPTKPEETPVPPGGGNKYFDLRLLALGQHIGISGTESFTSVPDAIDKMRQLPPASGNNLPVPVNPQLGQPYFNPQNSWLVGADFGILKLEDQKKICDIGLSTDQPANLSGEPQPSAYFLSLSVIFNDPDLYALRIALDGKAAKIFKGLDFQIMYRKINDTVGVYQAEIKLPDSMRELSVGAYSLTLPVFAIEIYTNGDFKVDIGFPWNMNFSRSFTVQGIVAPGIPLLGSGGFYFGKLSSATTNRVPATTKGNFNPVLIFGLGMQVGVGKYIEKGILRAGFSITVFGIIEGIIARWNPNVPAYTGDSPNNQLQGEYYFWLQGTLGVIGKLFGSVDFDIIKADVNVELMIMAQITYESYASIPISVVAQVDIAVSIKINLGFFKVKISFSFSAKIKETFVIENSGHAPWEDIKLSSNSMNAIHKRQLRAVRMRGIANGDDLIMNWSNLQRAEHPTPLTSYLTPFITISSEEAAKTSELKPNYVMVLFMETMAADAPIKAERDINSETSFEKLCKQILRWVIAAAQPAGSYSATDIDNMTITDDLLHAILDRLSKNNLDSDDSSNLRTISTETFMREQFQLNIIAAHENEVNKNIEKDVVVFAMPRFLGLDIAAYNNVGPFKYAFDDFSQAELKYLSGISDYFNQLAVIVQEELKKPDQGSNLRADQKTESIASFIFNDYFLLIARQMVQYALDALRNFQWPILPKPGYPDTIEKIVEWVNITGDLSGIDMFNAQYLITSNSNHELTAGLTIYIPDGESPSKAYTTADYDTPEIVAVKFNIPIAALANDSRNLTLPGLFKAGSDEKAFLNITHLKQFKVAEIIKEIQLTLALNHISGMVSRYYLHGLRLPVKLPEGGEIKFMSGVSMPEEAGLYRILGQQFEIPKFNPAAGNENPYTINVTKSADLDWVVWDSNPGSTVLPIIPDTDAQIAVARVLESATKGLPSDTQYLGIQKMYKRVPAQYSFISYTNWQSQGEVNLPYGKMPKEASRALKIWQLPSSLTNLPHQGKEAFLPRFKIEIGTYNEAASMMESREVAYYGWGTRIDIAIKKIPANAACPAVGNTYELMGVSDHDIILLERILCDVQESMIDHMMLLYQPDPAENTDGLNSDDISKSDFFISQVNLTTVTKPPTLLAANNDLEEKAWHQSRISFIRELWENSITRSGGYYLYYSNTEDKKGFPNHIFNDQGEGKVSLLVIYNFKQDQDIKADQKQNQVASYMNVAMTAEGFDTSRSIVYARPYLEEPIEFGTVGGYSLVEIADKYYMDPIDIAEDNFAYVIAEGIQILITNGSYEVRSDKPSNPQAIASHFNITLEELKTANPDITDWPDNFPLYKVLKLPVIKVLTPSGQSLAGLSSDYGTSVAELAYTNQNTKIYDSSVNLIINGGPNTHTCNVPAGNVSFEAQKTVPADIPGSPIDNNFGELYLRHIFNLLSYRIIENTGFKGSNMGLPMSPVCKSSPENLSKIRKPNLPANEGELWEYQQTVPFWKIAKPAVADQGSNLPDLSKSPYQGIGERLQVQFQWQDLFGNQATFFEKTAANQTASFDVATLFIGYTDHLVGIQEWPAIASEYYVMNNEKGSPYLYINIAFDSSSFEPESDAEDSNTNWKEAAQQALVIYSRLYYQINQKIKNGDKDAVTFFFTSSIINNKKIVLNPDQLHDLKQMISDICQYLAGQAGSDYMNAVYPSFNPPQIEFDYLIEECELNQSQIYKLTAEFGMERDLDLVHPDFKNTMSVYCSKASIKPKVEKFSNEVKNAGIDVKSLNEFADHMEKALCHYGQYLFKVAAGADRNKTDSGEVNSNLWLVRLGQADGQGIYYQIINQDNPAIFAPRPISNQLESRNSVPIYDYQTGQKMDLENVSRELDFSGIDLDVWLKELLQAVDNFLSPQYISPLGILSEKKIWETDYLERIKELKKTLAANLKNMLIPVFENEPSASAGLEDAQQLFEQEMLVILLNFYNTNSVIQFKFRVDADIPGDEPTEEPPRIYGAPLASAGSNDFGLSCSKLELKPASKEKPAALTFLLNTRDMKENDNQMKSFITLDLQYQASHIEHQIGSLPGIEGYKASTWLAFITNNYLQDSSLNARLGNFDVPLVFRAYPNPPSMISQIGQTWDTNNTDLNQAELWNYSFIYSRDFHYPQDRIFITVKFNVKDNLLTANSFKQDLFWGLAEFITAYPAVSNDLDKYLCKIDTDCDDDVISKAAAAVEAFIALVDYVNRNWPKDSYAGINEVLAANEREVPNYAFYIEESVYNDSGKDALLISLYGNPPEGIIPQVSIDGYESNDVSVDGGYGWIYCQEGTKEPLTPSVGRTINKRRVTLSKLNIFTYQDALASAYLTRNEELVPGKRTAEPFVYQTPEINFTNPLHPVIDSNNEMEIAALNADKPVVRTLAQHLQTLFEAIFKDNNNNTIQMEVKYAFSLPNDFPIIHPVVMLPPITFTQDLAEMLANSINDWFDQFNPSKTKGVLYFDLSIMSNLNAQPMPLARFRRLKLETRFIS